MIYGNRIRLRAIERKELPTFVKWLNDPEVKQGMSIYRPFSEADEEKWFDGILAGEPDARPFAIEARTTEDAWQTIGNCGFHIIEWRNRSAELGIFIGDKSFRNHGYGSEAMQALVSYGFNTLNLHRICLRVFAFNLRAIHVYEKLGFIHEGRMRQAHYHEGEYHDVLWMSILRGELH
jgi:diamine N-acetyltransferase